MQGPKAAAQQQGAMHTARPLPLLRPPHAGADGSVRQHALAAVHPLPHADVCLAPGQLPGSCTLIAGHAKLRDRHHACGAAQ